MGGTATDFGQIMKKLVNDSALKTKMNISVADQTNYSKLISTYFIESAVSDVVTQDSLCRLLIYAAPQSPIANSEYVTNDNLAIEIYVPKNIDRMTGFERRSNQIVDELIKLFNHQLINDRRMRLVARHELVCSSPNYCRLYIQFSYKRVYS